MARTPRPARSTTRSVEPGRQLQDLIVAFVRGFGLLQPDRTPCNQPVSVSEAHALMELAGGARLSQQELADRLRLEKSSVSRLVAHLDQTGSVQRTKSQRDGRVLVLALTPTGEALAARIAQARATTFASLLAAIPPEDRQRALDGLALLVRALRQEPWADRNDGKAG